MVDALNSFGWAGGALQRNHFPFFVLFRVAVNLYYVGEILA